MTAHLCARCHQPIRDPLLLESLQHERAYRRVYEQLEEEKMGDLKPAPDPGVAIPVRCEGGYLVDRRPDHMPDVIDACPGCEKCNPLGLTQEDIWPNPRKPGRTPESAPESEEKEALKVFSQSLCLDCARSYDSKQTRECYTRGVKAVAAHVRQEQTAEIERLRLAIELAFLNLKHATFDPASMAALKILKETFSRDSAPDTGDTTLSLESRVAQLENELRALKERIGTGDDE